jgi:hypothetical protein
VVAIGTGMLSASDLNPGIGKEGINTDASTRSDVAVGSEVDLLEVLGVSDIVFLHLEHGDADDRNTNWTTEVRGFFKFYSNRLWRCCEVLLYNKTFCEGAGSVILATVFFDCEHANLFLLTYRRVGSHGGKNLDISAMLVFSMMATFLVVITFCASAAKAQ